MTEPQIPEGMVEVTYEQFFAALHREPRDVMPSNERPEFTLWRDQKGDRMIWGWTWPGWINPRGRPHRYAVLRSAADGLLAHCAVCGLRCEEIGRTLCTECDLRAEAGA